MGVSGGHAGHGFISRCFLAEGTFSSSEPEQGGLSWGGWEGGAPKGTIS